MDRGRSPVLMKACRELELRFLFIAALVTVACVLAADHFWLAGCVVALGCGLLATWLAGWKRGLALVLIGSAASLVLDVRKTTTRERVDVLLKSSETRVTAKALEDARGGPGGWIAMARIPDSPARGAKVMWRGRGAMPVAGSMLTAKGRFELPERPRNPGEFDQSAWMERIGCGIEFLAQGTTEIRTPRLAASAAWFRRGFEEAIVHGLDPESAAAQVISAMVIGKHPEDADEMIMAFRNSGTLHVFSVSGLHVAMVGGIGWLCASLAGFTRRRAVLLLIPLMFGYAWVTGNGPPAVRAACMAAIFLGAFAFRRKPDLLNALGTVLLATLLWDGRMLFQTGVQLSYGVVAAIAVGVGPAARLFRWISDKDPYLPDDERSRWQRTRDGAREWLAGSLSVSLAAGVGSTPLTIFHFGLVTPVSLLANLVLLPLVFGILWLALMAAAIHPVAPWASSWINRANAMLANGSAAAAETLSSVPGGYIVTRRPEAAKLLVYDLPFGQGAAVLTDEDGGALMFDCAGRGGFRRIVLPSLRAQGIFPHTAIFSHPDGGHMGGGYPVWRALPVREAVMPVGDARSTALRAWKSATHDGVRVRHAADVPRIDGPDGSVWHRLNTPFPGSSTALADDRVAVWRLDWRGWRVLFTSDAGFRAERELLEAGADVAADVVVSGKHRQDMSLADDFLTTVNPRVIIARNPAYPSEERHLPETVASWKARGIVLLDQMDTGCATLTVGGSGELVISGFLTPGQPLVLRK